MSEQGATEPTPRSDAATWWGHATVTIELGADRFLTDPLLRSRVGPLRWVGECPEPDLAKALSAVLVSHLHRDHLDLPSLGLVAPGTPVLVPHGAGGLVRRLRAEVVEMRAGDEVRIGAVTVRAVHAEHDGRRWPVGPPSPALGYLLRGQSTVYFAGDTDLFPGMADLRVEDIGLALLPVGGWGPTLGRGHLGPRAAAQTLRLLGPAAAVPIHWGTLRMPLTWRARPSLLTAPGAEFADHAALIAPDVRVHVAEPGERVPVPGRRG